MTAIALLHDITTGRFHAAYFMLAPFPGGVIEPKRWRSQGHHTVGSETEEGGREHLAKLREQLIERYGGDPVDLGLYEWDGTVAFHIITE